MEASEVDLKVDLGGLAMRTPVATASGTFGYGPEYVGAIDYSRLGAVTAKGVRLGPWPGNPMPRHVEVLGGLVNAIGLQGPGVDAFLGRSSSTSGADRSTSTRRSRSVWTLRPRRRRQAP